MHSQFSTGPYFEALSQESQLERDHFRTGFPRMRLQATTLQLEGAMTARRAVFNKFRIFRDDTAFGPPPSSAHASVAVSANPTHPRSPIFSTGVSETFSAIPARSSSISFA